MSNFETSANYELTIDSNVIGDDRRKLLEVHNYFDRLIDDINTRIDSGSRSVFDFVDIAVVIGTLANLTDNQSKQDTDQYIDFVRDEFFQVAETNRMMIARAFYCLMRCGLVHELSLAGHNIRTKRKVALINLAVILTHDSSIDGSWYSVNRSAKEVVFYAHELLTKTKAIVSKCFQPNSPHQSTIRNKLQTKGIGIIAVKS